MNIKNNLKTFMLGVVSLSVISSCTDEFEEINTNPNGPVEVAPALLLPGIQEYTADRLYSTFVDGDMGSTWIQHWGKVQYNDEERYDVRPGIIDAVWNGFYANSLTDTEIMYDGAKEEGNQALMGVALIMRSYVYSMLTDMYGDIPYTQALKADEGIISPAYDAQSTIYPALIDSLAKADQYIASGEGSLEASRDLMYSGTLEQWRKFANSLRFRLIMRASDDLDASYTAQLQDIVDSGVHFTSNADNAQLPYRETNPNANPVWNTIIFTTRSEWKVNQTIVETMKSLDDPRLEVYAQPNDGGEYRGVAPGIMNPTQNGFTFTNVSAIGWYFLQPDAPAVFMSFSELNFLVAEAAKRGLISGGDAVAEQFYNAGIKASFDRFDGTTVTDFNAEEEVTYSISYEDYIDNTDVAYNSSTALQQIGVQNWIALFGQGVEAWTEWRRTGYPVLSPANDPIRITEIPSRYPYPSDEQTLNNANYTEAANAMGGDEMTTPVWWMK